MENKALNFNSASWVAIIAIIVKSLKFLFTVDFYVSIYEWLKDWFKT